MRRQSILPDGLTESIINNLTQLPGLRVIARNSAFRIQGREPIRRRSGRSWASSAVVVGRVLQRARI